MARPVKSNTLHSMRRTLAFVMFLFAACGSPTPPPARDIAREAGDGSRTVPISDLHFKDHGLQEVAATLVRKAHQRGIEVSSGRNRIERLIALEASLGGSTAALERVNTLVSQMTANDVGRWAKLRQRADLEFQRADDDAAKRVRDLLKRWQLEKTDAAWSHLSSNYKYFIGRDEWERKFYEFVSTRPRDAATWGWLIARHEGPLVQEQYGRADAETAYRFYLEFSRFGDAREAREVFSVPGVAMEEGGT